MLRRVADNSNVVVSRRLIVARHDIVKQLLVYTPSLEKIESWYHSFVERCPLPDGQERAFPFVCVGNKHDLAVSPTEDLVKEQDAVATLRGLCPPLKSNDTTTKDFPPSEAPGEFSFAS